MVKPGWTTTEFLVALILILLDAAMGISGMLSPEAAATLATVTGGIYKVVRMVNKYGVSGASPQEAAIQTLLARIEALEHSQPGGPT